MYEEPRSDCTFLIYTVREKSLSRPQQARGKRLCEEDFSKHGDRLYFLRPAFSPVSTFLPTFTETTHLL